MGLSVAHGKQTWSSADAAGTTYPVSGLGFAPKALIFWTNGQQSDVGATTETTNARVSIGFAVSATSRACMGFLGVDAAASMDCQEYYRTDAVIANITATPGFDAQLDISTFDSDGFTLVVDDQIPTSITVFWFAMGGTDITAADVMEITEPAATGNVNYGTVSNPTVCIFAGCQLIAAAPTTSAQDSGLMLGAATGSTAQWVIAINQDDGSAASDADQYMRGDECLAMMTVAGGNPSARATFVSFGAANFTLNWLARVSTRKFMALVLAAGSNVKAGTYTIDTLTVGNTATVSGLAFQPVGALAVSHGVTQSLVGTSTTSGLMSIGAWTSTTSRRAMGLRDEDATATAELNLAISYDEIISLPSATGGQGQQVDLDAINTDGFRVIIDTVGVVTSDLEAYITFGNPPPAPGGPAAGLRTQSLTGVGL